MDLHFSMINEAGISKENIADEDGWNFQTKVTSHLACRTEALQRNTVLLLAKMELLVIICEREHIDTSIQ